MIDGGHCAADDVALAACLFAADPCGMGGIAVRAAASPVRDRLLALIRQALPDAFPFRRTPLDIADARLLGGLDLAATLRSGRPVLDKGLLAEVGRGVIVLPMAERMSPSLAARLASVLDTGTVSLERDGFAASSPVRLGVIAFDEGIDDDERPPLAIADRLALHVFLDGLRAIPDLPFTAEAIARVRRDGPSSPAAESVRQALAATAALLGVNSPRAWLLAARVARVHAALCGRTDVGEPDAIVAARLVLAPRATRLPSAEPEATQEADQGSEQPADRADGEDSDSGRTDSASIDDVVLESARAAIPAHLLKSLAAPKPIAGRGNAGRAGAFQASKRRGRPAGTRRGDPASGMRLNVIETLRAAAPWQRLRQGADFPKRKSLVAIRREDFRVTRFKHRSETATIFVVDASGSAALHRLAEAKGAVELLLADCYVRRDQVALLAFRGAAADILLPPTRSLARAKRALAALPGGGGTPLAAACDAARLLALALRRKGLTPSLVFLTDGRANVARNGETGRHCGETDALAAAKALRAAEVASILIDTSPQPDARPEALARALGARYLPMPRADAAALSAAARNLIAV